MGWGLFFKVGRFNLLRDSWVSWSCWGFKRILLTLIGFKEGSLELLLLTIGFLIFVVFTESAMRSLLCV
jgi:hypothetical protein